MNILLIKQTKSPKCCWITEVVAKQCSVNDDVLQNSTSFTGKHLWWNLLLAKLKVLMIAAALEKVIYCNPGCWFNLFGIVLAYGINYLGNEKHIIVFLSLNWTPLKPYENLKYSSGKVKNNSFLSKCLWTFVGACVNTYYIRRSFERANASKNVIFLTFFCFSTLKPF